MWFRNRTQLNSHKNIDQSNGIERLNEFDWARSSAINTIGFDLKMDGFDDGLD